MLPESCLIQNLQTIICEMYFQIFSVDIVLTAAGPEVSFIKEVNIKLPGVILNMHKRPHPHIELPLFVQKWPLNILLDNPLRIWCLLIKELYYVSYLWKHLDSFALIHCCRLEDPLVIFTMLLRQVRIDWYTFTDVHIWKELFETEHRWCWFLIKQESCRQNVKYLDVIIAFNSVKLSVRVLRVWTSYIHILVFQRIAAAWSRIFFRNIG